MIFFSQSIFTVVVVLGCWGFCCCLLPPGGAGRFCWVLLATSSALSRLCDSCFMSAVAISFLQASLQANTMHNSDAVTPMRTNFMIIFLSVSKYEMRFREYYIRSWMHARIIIDTNIDGEVTR